MPSLDTAYLLVERAREQLEELKALHDTTCAAQAESTIIKQHGNPHILPDQMTPLFSVKTGTAPIPPKCRILVGEVSNSLRSALNYLTARLFELDAGTKGTHVQFPIESTPHKFKRQRDRYLRGISEVHVAAIERLQPYNGNEWATNLQRLSNLHKHDDLVIVAHDYLLGGNLTVSSTEDPNVQRFTMRMNIKPALRIALGDGLPVVEALEVIQGQVAQTLDAFKLEF